MLLPQHPLGSHSPPRGRPTRRAMALNRSCFPESTCCDFSSPTTHTPVDVIAAPFREHTTEAPHKSHLYPSSLAVEVAARRAPHINHRATHLPPPPPTHPPTREPPERNHFRRFDSGRDSASCEGYLPSDTLPHCVTNGQFATANSPELASIVYASLIPQTPTYPGVSLHNGVRRIGGQE